MNRMALTAILCLWPIAALAQLPGASQQIRDLRQPATLDPRDTFCAGGAAADDGSFEDGYRIPFATDARFVQLLTPPTSPALVQTACVCWESGLTGGSMTYNFVLYDASGPGGQPGRFLGSVPASVNVGSAFSQASVTANCTALGLAVSGPVYVGVDFDAADNDEFFVCADESVTTPLATMYQSANGGASWEPEQIANSAARALGLRATFTQASGCVPSGTTLCIDQNPGDRRFQIQVHYSTTEGGGMSGSGQSIPLSSLGVTQGGLFWFFGATNPEMLIKIIDGCPLDQHFWVFFAATTNVGFTVTVTDTSTGNQAVYRNQDKTAALPVQDTNALICP